MHNHHFWGGQFHRVFIPHLRRLLEVLEARFLPTLDAIGDEALELEDQLQQELCSAPSDGESDPCELAKAARDQAMDFYFGMDAVRQSVVNGYAAILYHAWEQQLLTFHRREMLHPTEAHDRRFMRWEVLTERLEACGIVLESLPSWSTVDELRVLANTVKHADGNSAEALRQRFPRYFEDPGAPQGTTVYLGSGPRVYRPLSGDDIYVRLEDLQRFVAALADFWSEFEAALATARKLDAC